MPSCCSCVLVHAVGMAQQPLLCQVPLVCKRQAAPAGELLASAVRRRRCDALRERPARPASGLVGTGCGSTRTRRGAWTSDRIGPEGAGRARHSTSSASPTIGCGRGRDILSCARPRPRAASHARREPCTTGVADTGTTRSTSSGSTSRACCGGTGTTTGSGATACGYRVSTTRSRGCGGSGYRDAAGNRASTGTRCGNSYGGTLCRGLASGPPQPLRFSLERTCHVKNRVR